MAGIIHFPTSSRARRTRAVTRRTLMLGAAGYAVATLGPHVAAQNTATPEATPGELPKPIPGLFKGEARQRLTALLEYVPSDLPGGPDPNSWLFTWLDFQTRLIALGNPDPYAETTDLAAMTAPLISSDPLFQYALVAEIRTTFGFTVWDVHQTLTVDTLPDQVTYYAGGLPTADLPAIWEAAGYVRHEGDAGDYWTAGEHGEMDLGSPIGQFGGGRMNNVAILDQDIVVFTRTAEQLQQIQGFATNGGTSAADNVDLAALIGVMPADAVNVVALPGSALNAQSITPENPGAQVNQTTRDLLAESDNAVGPMPPSTMAFFGITAGVPEPEMATPDATPVVTDETNAVFFVDVLTGSEDEATATAEIVAWRIEHMASPVAGDVYRDLLTPLFAGDDAVQGPVAALTFSSPRTVAIWIQLLFIQDLWPFVWLSAE